MRRLGTVLPLAAVALAVIVAALFLLELAPFCPDEAEETVGTGEAPVDPDAGSPRLVGVPAAPSAPSALDAAPIAHLVREIRLQGYGDEEVREALRRRVATGGDDVSRLLALLRLTPRELAAQDLRFGQVLYALVAIGSPAAAGLARVWIEGDSEGGRAYAEALAMMGPAAAPAVPILVAWLEESGSPPSPGLAQVFGRVGPAAREAVPLLARVLETPVDDAAVRAAGKALLQVAGTSPDVLEAFRAALLDEDTLARPGLLYVLGRHGGAGIAPLVPLLVELLTDPELETRSAAAFALGKSGAATKDVLLGLVRVLEDGTQQEQRTAAMALADLGAAGEPPLVEIVRGAEDVRDRLAAFQALTRAGADLREHVPALLRILDEDVERTWKARALLAVASMDPLPAPEALLPHLAHALTEPRLEKSAVSVLARLPGEEARSLLLDHARTARDPTQALVVIRALGAQRTDEPRAAELLVDLLDHLDRIEDEKTLRTAVLLFRGLRPPASAALALPSLERLYRSAGRTIVLGLPAALQTLTGDDEAVVTLLLEAVAGDDAAKAMLYAMALTGFPSQAPRSVPVLLETIARWHREGPGGIFAMCFRELRAHWSGSGAALERAIRAASAEVRPALEALR